MPGPTWIVSPLPAAATAGPIWLYWHPLGHTVSVAADTAPAPSHSNVIAMGISSTIILAPRHDCPRLIASPLRHGLNGDPACPESGVMPPSRFCEHAPA